jgi:hypothetical protein
MLLKGHGVIYSIHKRMYCHFKEGTYTISVKEKASDEEST